jgi:hypothetical protein
MKNFERIATSVLDSAPVRLDVLVTDYNRGDVQAAVDALVEEAVANGTTDYVEANHPIVRDVLVERLEAAKAQVL